MNDRGITRTGDRAITRVTWDIMQKLYDTAIPVHSYNIFSVAAAHCHGHCQTISWKVKYY